MAFKNRDGSPMKKPPREALAKDRVRFVGDPVAFVVAETQFAAREAADAIALDIEPLPAAITAEEAVADGAPVLYDDVPATCSSTTTTATRQPWTPPSRARRM
jgi:carbon-monoxide dehydrogenase large subunit